MLETVGVHGLTAHILNFVTFCNIFFAEAVVIVGPTFIEAALASDAVSKKKV